ncbi:MAG: hypothetical protein NTW21_31810, partial [Verrucomicrobia bacterium]|nr:hypothetical protein [Verrucomicrobiota bacterium]
SATPLWLNPGAPTWSSPPPGLGTPPVWRWRPDDTSAAQGLAQRRFIHARLAGRCRNRAPGIEEPGAWHGLFRGHDRRAARGRWQVNGTGTLICQQ